MDSSIVENTPQSLLDFTHHDVKESDEGQLMKPMYAELLNEVHKEVVEGKFETTATAAQRNILRIGKPSTAI